MFAAADDAGRARGLATLRQLGPVVPGLLIEDAPRYAWRGVMLDVARHFFGVDDVLRFIDLAALYKLNVLHLHLTDDQGWRLAIDAWPELTVAGAATQVGGGPGGFYTRADYARIVAHAASHHITVVPEIDVPGHVNAALVAYPELGGGSRPEPYTVWSSPGVSLAVNDEIALRFLDDVFRELAALTPGDYIHLGGDEVEGMDRDGLRALHVGRGLAGVAPRQAAGGVGGGRHRAAAGGHDRPALVRRRPRPRRGRAGPAAADVPRAAHLPRPEVRRDHVPWA